MDAIWLDTVMVDLDAWLEDLMEAFELAWQGERAEEEEDAELPQTQVYSETGG